MRDLWAFLTRNPYRIHDLQLAPEDLPGLTRERRLEGLGL